jgi:hypothetical protein
MYLQAAASDREAAVAAVREEAAAQLRAAQEGAAAAQALLAEAQAAAAAESERMASEKSELDKQLKVAQVRACGKCECLRLLGHCGCCKAVMISELGLQGCVLCWGVC